MFGDTQHFSLGCCRRRSSVRTAATQSCSHQWSCWSCAFVVDGGVLSDVVQQSRENHSSSTYAPPSGLTNQLSPQSKQTPVVKTTHQTLVSLLCRMFCTHFELADIQGKKCSAVNESRFSTAQQLQWGHTPVTPKDPQSADSAHRWHSLQL